MEQIREIREKRARLATEARQLLDGPKEEKRDLTAEEAQQFDAIHSDIEKLGRQLERLEKQESLESDLGESRGPLAGRPDTEGAKPQSENRKVDPEEVRDAMVRLFAGGLADIEAPKSSDRDVLKRAGIARIGPNQFNVRLLTGSELRRARRGDREERALAAFTDASGGYLVEPLFSGMLEESLKAFGGMREVAQIVRTATGHDVEWPTVDDTGNTGAILAENTADAEQDFTFGQKVLKAYKYTSKIVRVAVELMQDSAFDLPGFLARGLGTRIARITNTHFTTGDDTSKPQGVVTGASSAVTAAAQTTVTFEELLDLLHGVDPAYRNPIYNPRFMFNDGTLKTLKKLKDGEGRPLWQPGLVTREPDTLLGYPYTVNQDVAALAASSKSILFGGFAKYIIRDVLDVTLVRMVERYGEFHQVAFVAISRHDGRVLDAGTDPIKFITQAA